MPVREYADSHIWGGNIPYGDCDSCGNSGVWLFAEDDDDSPPWVCPDCYETCNGGRPGSRGTPANNGEIHSVEESYSFESDYEPAKLSPLVLPEIVGRQARLISFEQELGAGGADVAQRLYSGGFSRDSAVLDYHGGERRGFCHVEEDSSVNAEIIYSKLDLSKADVASRFEQALNIVKGTITDGPARLTLACGGHFHVDVGSSALPPEQRYGMADVESLYHVWNHLEDVIYRLGSANWRTHRTLSGSPYSPETRKGIIGRGDLGQHFEQDRGALNFSNFLAARSYCRCGAFTFEDWQSCVCELPKATVEFRVFNGTANLRKIHAYSALSLALVEYAKRNTVKTDDLPSFGWTRSENIVNSVGAETSLSFLFKELPLTYDEKQDLLYCVKNSSLRDVADTVTIRRNRRREEALVAA